jgi:hypothetical protein
MIEQVALRLDRRKGRGWYAEPLEWKVTGVISPLGHRWWGPPFGLVCSPGGIIIVRRSNAGFWSAGMGTSISADDAYALAGHARGPATAYSRKELRAITVRWRFMKHRIRIGLTGGSALDFYVFARDAIGEYRSVLRETYPDIYREQGFHWFEE